MSSHSRPTSAALPRPVWMLLAALVLVLVASAVRFGLPMYRQYGATQALGRVGGLVGTRTGGPRWLRGLIGDAWMSPFDTGENAQLHSTGVRDADLVYLRDLPDLRILSFSHRLMPATADELLFCSDVFVTTEIPEAILAADPSLAMRPDDLLIRPRITDAGLVHIEQLKQLEWLNLVDTEITDAGAAHLKGLTNLRRLDLEGTRVTDTGVAHLAGLVHLESLGLTGPGITDAALVHIGQLKKLRCLRLLDTNVTGIGLANLRQLPNLTGIALSGSPLTDEGLRHLAGMSSLTHLLLTGTEVTDDGLAHLVGMSSLSLLRLGDTRITVRGLEHLPRLTALTEVEVDGNLEHRTFELVEGVSVEHLDSARWRLRRFPGL